MSLPNRREGITATLWAAALAVLFLWIIKLFFSPQASRFFTSWMEFF